MKLFFDWSTRQWSTRSVTQDHDDRLLPVQEVGGGWVRLGIYVTLDVQNDPTGSIRIGISDGDGNASTALMTPTNNIQIWGCQMENRRFYTSIIPTAGAQAARGRDNIICNGDDFQSIYGTGQDAFTMRYTGYAAPQFWQGQNFAGNNNNYVNIGRGTNLFSYYALTDISIQNVYTWGNSGGIGIGGDFPQASFKPFVAASTYVSGVRNAAKSNLTNYVERLTPDINMTGARYVAFGQYNETDNRQKTVNIIGRFDYWPIAATQPELEALAPDS